ncbi:MAG: ABC transporter permease subunit [Holophagales bacterium]|nr:MAG: ABC transporter permease subunit [Holophagales bacterium]
MATPASAPSPLPSPGPAATRPASKLTATPRRRLVADRAARILVSAGGIGIIASILGILLFIVAEVLPLGRPAEVSATGETALPAPTLALVGDEYRTHLATVAADGRIRVVRLADGVTVADQALDPASSAAMPVVAAAVPPGASMLAAATADGRVLLQPVDWEVAFDGQQRRQVSPRLGRPRALEVDPAHGSLTSFAAIEASESGLAAAAQTTDGSVRLVEVLRSTNLMTGEVEETLRRSESTAPGRLGPMVLDHQVQNLFAGTASGELVWWPIEDGQLQAPRSYPTGSAAITALTLLIGDRSLVVGQADGALSVWYPVRQGDESFLLTRIRDFPRQPGAISLLAPSQRNRTFLAVDASGGLGLFFSTSNRTLWRGTGQAPGATAASFSPKADGLFLAAGARLHSFAVRNAHPETTWSALFSRVWYEGYERPGFSWQSTGGTDDFEPKLSLTPLLIGTLKGTFYSLLLAIPLGVLGAMYASQFMHPSLLRLVKPTVEIMAALPSVVLGFLAGLWLAPRVERAFSALLLLLVVVPAAVIAAGLLWRGLPATFRNRMRSGAEVLWYLVVIALSFGLCFALAPAFERLAFAGDFQAWLLATTGETYDQRNAIVVGLAMGFAVIPIIFAISEDAFSNVPRNLVAGSLALGANRWQTVTRVVLPTASPGIFSGVMIGFGRAVGETMIVLMATGNTPITSWSPFNGFRTLSANIAVEIPEAPHGGTLYRTLFLAALLLFAITFVVNTLAELVRQRLRRKFAQL